MKKDVLSYITINPLKIDRSMGNIALGEIRELIIESWAIGCEKKTQHVYCIGTVLFKPLSVICNI